MKKLLALLLALALVLSMAACGKKEEEPEDGNNTLAVDTTPVEEAAPDPWTHEFTQYGNGTVKIVGAEFAKNDWDEDILRVYYDYTNTSTGDDAMGHYLPTALNFLSVKQDGQDCRTYFFGTDDEIALPEDLNTDLYVQPGVTTRNTMCFLCDPNGGVVEVSCYLMIGGWVFSEADVEPFNFQIDPKDMMGAPEPFTQPEIPNPTYTASMAASGSVGYPHNSDISIDGVELTKDSQGQNVLRINLTVTNNDEEDRSPATLCSLEVYQDGLGLPYPTNWDMDEMTESDDAYSMDLYPGETVKCSALYYLRNENPVEVVTENPNFDVRLGACFDVKALLDAAAAAEQAAAEAATAEEAAARKALVGTWLQRDSDWEDTYIFNADGSGMLISGPEYPFTYAISGDILTLIYGPDDEEEFTIDLDGNLLTMIDMWDEELLLDKQAEEEPKGQETEAPTEEPTEEVELSLAEELIGTWINEGMAETYTFKADGTGSWSVESETYTFTYKLTDSYMEVTFDVGEELAFDVEIYDGQLIVDGYYVYDRQ